MKQVTKRIPEISAAQSIGTSIHLELRGPCSAADAADGVEGEVLEAAGTRAAGTESQAGDSGRGGGGGGGNGGGLLSISFHRLS